MAFRLTFESDGDAVRLVRKRRVDMIAPDEPAEARENAPGVWAELRNAHDETVHQVDLSQQFEPTAEVFSESGRIERVDAPDEKRLITVIVPEPADAREVVVVRRGGSGRVPGSRRMRSEAADAAEELARVSLFDEDGQ